MYCLPDEVILHIVEYLEPESISQIQAVSRRFLALTRDDGLWKRICFHHSRFEMQRRRERLISSQEPSLAALRMALPSDVAMYAADNGTQNPEMRSINASKLEVQRAMANWDPSYPGENINYYQEYIHRHAPISVAWLQSVSDPIGSEKQEREALGMGIFPDSSISTVEKVVAPLDDGSICMWNVSSGSDHNTQQGRILARSSPGFLNGQPNGHHPRLAINEVGAFDNVSVDATTRRAYIANHDYLNEVDLATLQIISKQKFPFPITALSEAKYPTPITVGTNMTLHLHDPRIPLSSLNLGASAAPVRTELIAGTAPRKSALIGAYKFSSHSVLSQPGPLSILHLPSSSTEYDSIWVAGRFTSLLNYSRRAWPKLHGTVHSGARLSALTSLPFPYHARESPFSFQGTVQSAATIRAAKAGPGRTLIAAGEYKGKGSLELYALTADSSYATSASSTADVPQAPRQPYYQNRQTASRSRLLSVCPHGGRLVFSDGDGNVKWVERDGRSDVRTWNVNQDAVNTGRTLFVGAADSEDSAWTGDIVQKLVPTRMQGADGGASLAAAAAAAAEVSKDNLLLWTGDGKIGMLGFGRTPVFDGDGAAALRDEAEEWGEAEALRRREERDYAGRMRRALERQADETRFVRGLGLGLGGLG